MSNVVKSELIELGEKESVFGVLSFASETVPNGDISKWRPLGE